MINIQYESSGRVGIITLNRPEVWESRAIVQAAATADHQTLIKLTG